MEKFKGLLKKDGIYILYGICMLITILSTSILAKGEDDLINFDVTSVILIFILGIIYIFLLKDINIRKMAFCNVFLIIAIPLGIMYCIVNPISQTPDEHNLALRAYDISNGHFISKLDDTGNASAMFSKDLTEFLNTSDRKYETYVNKFSQEYDDIEESGRFSNTALYAPICYLPQAVGIWIGKILHLNVIVQLYLARIVNMLTAIALIYFSMKIIPLKKMVVFVVAILPMTINEFATLSPDALTISLSIFFVSYILYLRYTSKNKITKNEYIILAVSSIILSMCKIVYLPLCLLLFLVPNDRFKNKKEKLIKVGILFGVVVLINLIWLGIASRYLVEYNEGVNSPEQVKFILTHPIKYIFTLLKTLNIWIRNYYLGLVRTKYCRW